MTTAIIDTELAPVLRAMEDRGVLLDVSYLESLAGDFHDQLAHLEEQIFEAVGHPFAISSPKKLSEVLFGELHLGEADGVRLRKKTTGFSTAAHELEKLQAAHPVIPLILKYREIGKLLSTYVLPLPRLVDGAHRLHTTYAPDAASGRLSSRQPNLQNIPIRTELGRLIRRAFIAPPGACLLAVDYSQIELRILAHFSGDRAMQTIFQEGGDIHTATATALAVDRRTAKAINFGIVYGLTGYGLAEALGVSREEGQRFIDGFLGTYPQVAAYMSHLIDEARRTGYAETQFGKRRALPDLLASNEYLRRAAERVALNHPIQGTEAEIMKLAMITLAKELALFPQCAMILQVHDELVFEVGRDQLTDVLSVIKRIMEQVVPLAVPLVVDSREGTNWAEMEPIVPSS